jgi:hypothetical protein
MERLQRSMVGAGEIAVEKPVNVVEQPVHLGRGHPRVREVPHDLLVGHAEPAAFLHGDGVALDLGESIDVGNPFVPEVVALRELAQMRQFVQQVEVQVQRRAADRSFSRGWRGDSIRPMAGLSPTCGSRSRNG